MKQRLAVALPFLCLVVLLAGCRSNSYESPASATAVGLNPDIPGVQDSIFAHDALNSGSMEINIGHLGIERAQNVDLKLLAQRIVDDHLRANEDLQRIVEQQLVPQADLPLHEDQFTALKNVTGTKFDQMYIRHLISAHRDEIRKFRAAARNTRNSDVRDFAGRMLPVLEEHLRIAENINKIAALHANVNEPAGAERPGSQLDPFYQGDPQVPHQFDQF